MGSELRTFNIIFLPPQRGCAHIHADTFQKYMVARQRPRVLVVIGPLSSKTWVQSQHTLNNASACLVKSQFLWYNLCIDVLFGYIGVTSVEIVTEKYLTACEHMN